MDQLHDCVEQVVEAGVRAYVGLLCCGEKVRSRRVLTDTMQISSLASGGPSSTLPPSRVHAASVSLAKPGCAPLARVLVYYAVRSLLASLLVLRATAYWARVPALGELQDACALLSRCLDEGDESGFAACEPATGPEGTSPARV